MIHAVSIATRSWINEGFSELGVLHQWLHVGGSDWATADDPTLSWNDWTSLSDRPEVLATTARPSSSRPISSIASEMKPRRPIIKHDENG
jgi:hypothetical protein